jgi:hypothetical protein
MISKEKGPRKGASPRSSSTYTAGGYPTFPRYVARLRDDAMLPKATQILQFPWSGWKVESDWYLDYS